MAQKRKTSGFDASGVKGASAEPRRARSLLAEAAEVRAGADEPRLMVPLSQLAPYPHNPAEREDPADQAIQELARSIGEIGVLQPAVVIPAEGYVERYPQDAELIGSRRFVVLAGVGRLTASRLAGLDEMPVVVRPELLERATAIALHENFFRRDLTPLQEAEALQRVMDEEGLSQRQLAKTVARSQSQISKRLRLLQLPPAAQDLLRSGRLQLKDAVRVLDQLDVMSETIPPDEREEVDQELNSRLESLSDELTEYNFTSVAREARDAVIQRRAAAEAQQRAKSEGVQLINPGKDLGGSWTEHRLASEEDVEQARGRGDLAIAVSGEDVSYYRVSEPPKVESRRLEVQARKDEQAEARKARKARESVLAQLVRPRPKQADLVESLSWVVLSGHSLGAERMHLARVLAQTAGVGPADEDDHGWRSAAAEDGARQHLAWIGAMALRETRLHTPGHRWDATDREYLRWLVDRGYSPTSWEQEQLGQIPEAELGEDATPIPVESPQDQQTDTEVEQVSHEDEEQA